MAQYKRPPKTKAKGPDEFVSFFDHLVRYFLIHRLKLFVVLGVGAAFFVGYGIFLYVQNQRVKEFATLYQDALEAPPEAALANWDELKKKNPPKALKPLIQIQIGGVLAARGDWQGAAASYAEAAESKETILKYLATWAQAVSLENAGDYQAAAGVYREMGVQAENPFKDFGALGEAQSLAQLGQKDQARSILIGILQSDAKVPAAVKSAALSKMLALELESAGETTPAAQK